MKRTQLYTQGNVILRKGYSSFSYRMDSLRLTSDLIYDLLRFKNGQYMVNLLTMLKKIFPNFTQ